MTIFIARDGEVIGEYPRAALEELARNGALESTDHYWQEGMEDWLPLPDLLGPNAWQSGTLPADGMPAIDSPEPDESAPPFPIRRVATIAAACACFVLAGGLLIYFTNASGNSESAPSHTVAAPPLDAATEAEIRDKAAADLRHRIEQLPGRAVTPLNTFYYDVSVNMRKMLSQRTPWSATIRGGENVIDPATEQTIRRTEFTLTADYEDGQWTYKNYQASSANLVDFGITEVLEDEDSPTPPSLAGMLGLKTKKR